GTVVLHVAPEAAAGGPLALVRTGDPIVLDVGARTLHLDLPPGDLARRTPPEAATAAYAAPARGPPPPPAGARPRPLRRPRQRLAAPLHRPRPPGRPRRRPRLPGRPPRPRGHPRVALTATPARPPRGPAPSTTPGAWPRTGWRG